jgi:hypothetical protein
MTVVAMASIASLGCAAVSSVKEPKYTVKASDGDFELRRYASRVVATTEVPGDWGEAGSEGFRRLGGYIFGKNRGRAKIAMTAPVGQQRGEVEPAKIAMTAPVGQQRHGDLWTVTFTMPEGETLSTLPAPEDARVLLRELPPALVAVVRFSGGWSDERMSERGEALRGWVAARGLRAIGEPEVNRYDPPFMPWFLRRNEVWFKVDEPAEQR